MEKSNFSKNLQNQKIRYTKILIEYLSYNLILMRILLIPALSLFLLASCTFPTTNNPTTTTTDMVSPTGAKYASSLQKSIPSPSFGSGKHTITIYADFQCPACIAFSEKLGDVFQSYADTGKTVLVYKQFPLTNIHKNAYRDAIAALCAAEQGKYLEYKHTLYALEKDKAMATVTDADRIEIARANGIDVASMTQCLSESRYAAQVDREIAEGDAA
jgi:protein-disulfide isomerase